jgi:hypothetical protein
MSSYKIIIKDYMNQLGEMTLKEKQVLLDKLSDYLAEHELDVSKYLNESILMFPKNRIFTFCNDKEILFFNHIKNRKYFNLEPNFVEYEKLIEISKKFNNCNDNNKRRILYEQFMEEVKNVDTNKFIELIRQYDDFRNTDKDRVRSDIKFFCDELIKLNLPKYEVPIFFNAVFNNYVKMEEVKLDIDIYSEHFYWGQHAFFICYYPKNNTFYVIDPDKDDIEFYKIINVVMKFFCKGLEYEPKYRIVTGNKVQKLTKDNYCTIHSLDIMRQISENPSILELDNKELCEYFLKDYMVNGVIDIHKLYDTYISRYYR